MLMNLRLRAGLAASCLLAFVAACSSSEPAQPSAGDVRELLPETGSTSSAITYWQHVRPVLEEKCATCHVAGGIAPFTLDTYAAAKMRAGAIADATGARVMPPWPPGPLSPKMMHDRSLSDAQIALLGSWVAGGAAEGDATAAAPLAAAEVVRLPTVDVKRDIGVDYTPPSGVTDDYRCFLVELGTTEDRVSLGYRVTPGNPKTVHHVITSLFDGASLDALRALDAESPDRAGWPCSGGPVPQSAEASIKPVGALGSWVPGVSTVLFPAGTGTLVPKGSVTVMQIHYNIHEAPAPDRTTIEVALAPKGKEPALRLATLPIRNRTMQIPPGAKDVAVETTSTARQLAQGRFYPDGKATLHMVAGHMHMVGVHFSLTLQRATGEKEVLLDIPAWNFHWQGSYALATPKTVGPDDVVTVRCVYDNTPAHLSAVGYPEAPRMVTNGEGSTDEMCIGYLTITD